MVVYGWLSGTSIAALFVAGVVPGVMIGIALMITCFVVSYWIEMPRSPRPQLMQLVRLFWRALPPLLTPLIIVGGIWTGIFTPTEAGAIACLYAMFLGFVVYRDVTFKDLIDVLAPHRAVHLDHHVHHRHRHLLTAGCWCGCGFRRNWR